MSHRASVLRWIPVRLFATGSAMVLSLLVASVAEQHMCISAMSKVIMSVAREVAHRPEPSVPTEVEALVRSRLARAGVRLAGMTVTVRLTDRSTQISARQKQLGVGVSVANRRTHSQPVRPTIDRSLPGRRIGS